MIPLFIGFTLVNWICLALTALLGYATASSPQARDHWAHWHILAGALSALTCCGVHCIVFTYFIATAKWVQHAVSVKKLDSNFTKPSRSFRAQAFPAAIGAILIVFITAVFGAAVDNGYAQSLWHHLLALLAIATNVLVALIEYRAIRNNGALIDDVLRAAATRATHVECN
jgi:hypothetical protein